jgi:hypothetical protein
MTTYHNRTIFKLECENCKKTIYPSETYATEYFNLKTKENINVLEAYKLRDNEKENKVFCGVCKPFRR